MAVATTVATGKVWVPGAEFVVVKGTTGDTYKSKKFKVVEGAVISPKSTTTTDTAAVSWSTDNTVTVTFSNSGTSQQAGIIIWGKHKA